MTAGPPAPATAEVGVVVVAAGAGTRFGGEVPKAFVPLLGESLLTHAVRRAGALPGLAHLVVVAPAALLEQARVHLARAGLESGVPTVVVAGGVDRRSSVAAGLAALDARAEIVLVHDAARALTPAVVFERVVAGVRAGHPAVVPGAPVVDTVKRVDARGVVVDTPDRSFLRAIQTPQGFLRSVLERAHAEVDGPVTDDASLVERIGLPVLVVEGDARAHKITTAADLVVAAATLEQSVG